MPTAWSSAAWRGTPAYRAASNFVVAAARLSALAVGGYLAVTHAITVGTVIAFLGYVGALFGPVQA
ncbi:MAG: hypothetical protein ACRETJ_08165 [Steroidobacteraceae bacterium]